VLELLCDTLEKRIMEVLAQAHQPQNRL